MVEAAIRALNAYKNIQLMRMNNSPELQNFNKGIHTFEDALLKANSTYENPKVASLNRIGNGKAYDFFKESLHTIRTSFNEAEKISAKAIVKEASEAEVVKAISVAETALQNIAAIRDKVISAYQDIIKMPI